MNVGDLALELLVGVGVALFAANALVLIRARLGRDDADHRAPPPTATTNGPPRRGGFRDPPTSVRPPQRPRRVTTSPGPRASPARVYANLVAGAIVAGWALLRLLQR